jgi:Uma2 family endonuclease
MHAQPIFRSTDRFTQEQFAKWLAVLPPGGTYHYELLDGFIVGEPPAGWPHSTIAVLILTRLAPYVQCTRSGQVFESSQGFDLATGDTVEPDVSFVAAARWRTVPRPLRGFLQVAPNLVFEVLSPSTRRLDMGEKKRIYARNGVEEYVLVDPVSRSIDVLQLAGETYGVGVRLTMRDTFESSVVTGFSMPVQDMFPSE